MARIRKVDQDVQETNSSELADQLRRFVTYAGDMIQAQQSVRQEMQHAREALEEAQAAYEKTRRAIARRHSESVKIDIRSNLEEAHEKLLIALSRPNEKIQAAVREMRNVAFWSGLYGGVLGAASVSVILFLGKI